MSRPVGEAGVAVTGAGCEMVKQISSETMIGEKLGFIYLKSRTYLEGVRLHEVFEPTTISASTGLNFEKERQDFFLLAIYWPM